MQNGAMFDKLWSNFILFNAIFWQRVFQSGGWGWGVGVGCAKECFRPPPSRVRGPSSLQPPFPYAHGKVATLHLSNFESPFSLHWKILHSQMYKAVFNKPESITLLSTEQIKFDLFRGRWILVEVFNGHTVPLPLLYQTSFRVRLSKAAVPNVCIVKTIGIFSIDRSVYNY